MSSREELKDAAVRAKRTAGCRRSATDEITFRVTSAQTGGAVLAAEVRMPPGGGPPALHRHDPDEVYRLERGQLAIYVEDDGGRVRRVVAGPRDVVHIAGGRAHTIRNESDADALAYVVFAPDAAMEGFVRAAARLAGDAHPPPRTSSRSPSAMGSGWPAPCRRVTESCSISAPAIY